MILRLCSPRLSGAIVAVAATFALSIGTSARADVTVDYTFTGVGNGTVDGNPWSGDFTFTFSAPTSNITSGGGEFLQVNIGGTFTEGSYAATLPAVNILAVNNDPSTPRVGFFNSTVDNGGTIQDSSLTTYALNTAFGPITGTGANLLPTFNTDGHGFGTTGGDTVELLGVSSLTFSATVQSVPEPSSLLLLSSAGVICLLVRSRRRRGAAHVRVC